MQWKEKALTGWGYPARWQVRAAVTGFLVAALMALAAVSGAFQALAGKRLAQAPLDRAPIDRAGDITVDVELVLAVDISLSMDPEEQRLQREGYMAALRDPEIIKAIRAGQHGKIAVTYMEWAGPDIQIHLIPWRLIDGRESAEAFVSELGSKEYSRFRRTSISAALEYSLRLFDQNRFRGVRRVIDVSGDGANNSGPPLVPIRDRIVESGVIINGLPIILRPTMGYSSWDLPNLDRYYASCVIGGPGSFMIPITKPDEFATATRQKLLMEISSITSSPRVVPVQLGPPPAGLHGGPQFGAQGDFDCGMLERGRRW